MARVFKKFKTYFYTHSSIYIFFNLHILPCSLNNAFGMNKGESFATMQKSSPIKHISVEGRRFTQRKGQKSPHGEISDV